MELHKLIRKTIPCCSTESDVISSKSTLEVPENPGHPETPKNPENPKTPDNPKHPKNPEVPSTCTTPSEPTMPTTSLSSLPQQNNNKVLIVPGPIDIKKIKNLVFQGGSVKGVSYGGAIGALHKSFASKNLDMHKEILNIAGTSAGAITALAMAVGANVEDLVMTIGNTDFKSFLDTKAYEIVSNISLDSASAASKTSAAMATLPLLTSSMGLASGQEVLDYLEKFAKEKTGISHLTFGELHNLVLEARKENKSSAPSSPTKSVTETPKEKGRYKDLFVVAYNLTSDEPFVFSYIDTPDSIISDAVRCSMSIPYVFVPHKNFIKKPKENKSPEDYTRIEASEDLWIDGGITDNYPIRVFDKMLSAPYEQTLGFYLASKQEKAEFEGNPKASEGKAEIRREIKNILDYSKAVIETVISSQQMSAHKQSGDINRTIYIDHLDTSMMNFGLTLEEKNALISSGWDAVCQRLNMLEDLGKCEVLLKPPQKDEEKELHPDDGDHEGDGYGDKCIIT